MIVSSVVKNYDGTESKYSNSYLLDGLCRYVPGTATCYYGAVGSKSIIIYWVVAGAMVQHDTYRFDDADNLIVDYDLQYETNNPVIIGGQIYNSGGTRSNDYEVVFSPAPR